MLLQQLYNKFVTNQPNIFINELIHMYLKLYHHLVKDKHQLKDQFY